MTTLRLAVNGTVRTVQISRAARGFVVEFDGARHEIDALETEPGRWSILAAEGHASHEVLVRAGQRGEWVVIVDGTVVPVRAADHRADGGAAADGLVRISAPMPGRVVRVLVAPGAAVEARQPLVVVEAMKMENELRAPRPGTVCAVAAREGASVDAGELLLTLE